LAGALGMASTFIEVVCGAEASQTAVIL